MTSNSPIRRTFSAAAGIALLAAVTIASADPTITSLGGGNPTQVTNAIGGEYTFGASGIGVAGAGYFKLNGTTLTPTNAGGLSGNGVSKNAAFLIGTIANNGQITGAAANPVSPAYSIPASFTTVTLPAGNAIAARYDIANGVWLPIPGIPNDAYSQSLGCFGSGDSGNVHTPMAISTDGRFVVGQGYISTYNSTGTQVVGTNSFRWRAWLYDAQGNGGAGSMRIMPTPFRTGSQPQRRRDGTAYGVSDDGLVICGAQEHNTSGTVNSADPDGSRAVVWRWDGSDYVMSYLPNGVNGSGFPYTLSISAGTMHMNAAGTIIVAPAIDDSGSRYIGKWVWNAGTQSWDYPINVGSNLATPASWLPLPVTTCGLPPTLNVSDLTEDGSTIIGFADYSTCGGFPMRGGWIWRSSDELVKDWYDTQVAAGTPGIESDYGPVEDGDGNPATGLVKLGSPFGISPDGSAIVGWQGGNTVIPEATPWIIVNNNGPACVSPFVTLNPAATETFSNCDSFILSARGGGTTPLSYQWFKDGNPIFDGPTGTGSEITGATSFLLRINTPNLTDEGAYHCEMTSVCGTAQTSDSTVTAAVAQVANDTCASAQTIGEGTNVFAWAPCGAFVNDGAPSWCQASTFADVWFSYVPSATGDVRIETCGANFDTVIDIFDQCNGIIIDCNDNYETGPSTGCTSSRSRIASHPVEIGVPVLIRVSARSGFLSTSASGNISIFNTPAPAPNDDCNNATVAQIGANAFDTNEATNDGIISCNATASRDVWFTFTPPLTGSISAQTCPGTTWNTVLSIHDGPCGGEIACNDNIPSPAPSGCSTSQSRLLNVPVTENLTYYIRIGGNSTSAFGPGNLNLSFNPLGDLNCDGVVDGADVAHFAQAAIDPAAYVADHDGSPYANCGAQLADFNQDSFIDTLDIPGFVDVLMGL